MLFGLIYYTFESTLVSLVNSDSAGVDNNSNGGRFPIIAAVCKPQLLQCLSETSVVFSSNNFMWLLVFWCFSVEEKEGLCKKEVQYFLC